MTRILSRASAGGADLFGWNKQETPCRRRALPRLSSYDVAPGDNDIVKRQKWVLLAMETWIVPCSNSTGPIDSCPWCNAVFRRALECAPTGPWAPT